MIKITTVSMTFPRIFSDQHTCPRAGREGDVVREELSILHHHVSVGGRVVEVTMDHLREHSRVGQRVTGDRHAGRRLSIGVGGRQQTLEARERLAPVGIAQIVAATVGVAILRRSTVNMLLQLTTLGR